MNFLYLIFKDFFIYVFLRGKKIEILLEGAAIDESGEDSGEDEVSSDQEDGDSDQEDGSEDGSDTDDVEGNNSS